MGEAPDKPNRRWFQFSLRTLLIAVLVLSMLLGSVGWDLDRTRKEQATVARFELEGGEFEYFHGRRRPGWLERRFQTVAAARFTASPISDIGPLSRLGRIESLCLDGTHVSDLTPLTPLGSLRELTVSNSPVHDLSPLAKLNKLRALCLDGTQVADAELRFLVGLPKLRWLSLRGTQVTDEGVKRLESLLPRCGIRR